MYRYVGHHAAELQIVSDTQRRRLNVGDSGSLWIVQQKLNDLVQGRTVSVGVDENRVEKRSSRRISSAKNSSAEQNSRGFDDESF